MLVLLVKCADSFHSYEARELGGIKCLLWIQHGLTVSCGYSFIWDNETLLIVANMRTDIVR